VVFDRGGGRVGRSSDNRLVLPDESVSRKHAQINYENGRYYLTDDSTNGTLICNSDLLVHHGKVELADGDILQVGDYELSVVITEESHAAADFPVAPGREISSPLKFEDHSSEKKPSGMDRPAAQMRPADQRKKPGILDNANSIARLPENIEDFFNDTGADEQSISLPEPEAGPADFTFEKLQVSDISDLQPASQPKERPKDLGVVQTSISAPDPLTETRHITQVAQSELFNLFLKGARIEDPNFVNNEELPEVMETLGLVFRELVNGLRTVLRGRTELKAEIRLAMTLVRPAGNNPLKLSPRIEDALKHLLKREHPGFLEPIDAVQEGFEDVMNHQLAMNAGIQASLLEALDQFDPQRFVEKNKDKSPFQTKGKYWRDYCAAYSELKDQALEGIFGKAFVRAYEEQLEKLRSKQKKS
jgi:type VI secretion system protein